MMAITGSNMHWIGNYKKQLVVGKHMEAIANWIVGNKNFVAIVEGLCKTAVVGIIEDCDKGNWD